MKAILVLLIALFAVGVSAQDHRCKDERGEYWSTSPCPEGERHPEADNAAQGSGADSDRPEWAETCTSVAEMAGIIMSRRQEGASMSKVMDAATNSGSSVAEEMVIEAYDSPAYSTDDYRESAVTEFTNTWYSKCLKEVR